MPLFFLEGERKFSTGRFNGRKSRKNGGFKEKKEHYDKD